jgi:hypothetical protein
MPRIIGYDISITGDTLYGPYTILDNQPTAQVLTSFVSAGANNIELNYSIYRNAVNHTGLAMISSNGVSSSLANLNSELSDLGVELSAVTVGANIEIQYTSTSTGFNGSFKFYRKMWS